MAPEKRLSPTPVLTADGSTTYLHPLHGASYRSTKGAATESRHVFLEGSGLIHRPGPWRVLELGFGTGLNFQVTCQAAQTLGIDLIYEALEPEPMDSELWLVDPCWHSIGWGQPLVIGSISLTLLRDRWQDVLPPQKGFDAVYHDPFGPAVAPENWTADCFRWGRSALGEHGVLATYGASSAARQAMKDAGLLVGILPGATGKREMTVAARSAEPISKARPWKRSASVAEI